MTDTYQLFTTYSLCTGNLKVRIVDGPLSTVAGKRNIRISNSKTLNLVLHVLNLSYNLISISQLTTISRVLLNFFLSYYLFQNLSLGTTIDCVRERGGLYYFDKVKVSQYCQIVTYDFVSLSRDMKFYYDIIEWNIPIFSI